MGRWVGVPSDNFVSTQLQLWLFCCWGCGFCWAVTIMFDASLKKLSNMDKYKSIIHDGTDLKDALFQLLSTVWETEVRPQQW